MLYFSHLLCDEEMREVIRETKMGVESIHFSISENLDSLEKNLIDYEKRLEYMECEELTLHGPFLDLNPMAYDKRIREVTRQRYEEAYQAAKKLGAAKIVYHTCYVPEFYLEIGWADRVAQFYREFLSDKDDSVKVVMENVLDQKPEVLRETAEGIVHPAFGLCLDVGHAHCYSGVDTIKWSGTLKPWLSHMHLHDNNKEQDRHMAVGKGSVPFKEIYEILKDKNDITGTIECSNIEDVLESYSALKMLINTKENSNLHVVG